MEENKKIKLISFKLDDYRKILCKFKKNIKIFLGITFIVPLCLFAFLYLMTKNIDSSILFTCLLFGVPYITMIIGDYLCIINNIDDTFWGIGATPIISLFLSYKFFSMVSFDLYFVWIASVLTMIIVTKFIIKSTKDMGK